jgi:hypothetical protein
VVLGISSDVVFKSCRYNRTNWDTMRMLEDPGELGDTRRTAISPTNAENDGVSFFLDFRP